MHVPPSASRRWRILRLVRASALLGTSALALATTARSGLAADECGPGVSVTCAGPSYPSITYSNDDQTVTLHPGAAVPGGIVLSGSGTQTLNAGQAGLLGHPDGTIVDVANATGDIAINVMSLSGGRRGAPVIGINAVTTTGAISIDVGGLVSITGPEGTGVQAFSGDAINGGGADVDIFTHGTMQVGDIEFGGLAGAAVAGFSHGGDVSVTADGAGSSLWALSHYGVGILAVATDGTAEVSVASGTAITGGWSDLDDHSGKFGTTAAAVILGGSEGATLHNDGVIGEALTKTANINSNSLAIASADLFGLSTATDVSITNRGTINGVMRLGAGENSVVNEAAGVWNTFHVSMTDTDPSFWLDDYRKHVAISDFGGNATFENKGTIRLATVPYNLNFHYKSTSAETGDVYVPTGLDAAYYIIGDATGSYDPNNLPAHGWGKEQAHLVNLDRFVNSGTIDLTETLTGTFDFYNKTGDVFVITGSGKAGESGGGTYVSDGGVLKLDVEMNEGGANTRSDVLVVDGTEVGAGGATTIVLNAFRGAGVKTEGDGILVVEVLDDERSAAGAFALDQRFAYNLYEYKLLQGGIADPNDGNWYLRGDIRGMGFVANSAPRLALQYGANLIDGYHQRRGEPEPLAKLTDDAPNRGVWARGFGTFGTVDPDDPDRQGGAYDYNLSGFQAGLDTLRKELADGSLFQGGLYFAIGRADATSFFTGGAEAGDLSFDAYTAGGYFTWVGANGAYVDVVGQGTFLSDVKGSSVEGDTLTTRGWLAAGSIEAGYPVWNAFGWQIEPQAQAVFQYGQLSDASETFSKVMFDDLDSLRGRVGVRVLRDFRPTTNENDPRRYTAAFTANLWNEFSGDTVTTFTGKDGANPVALNGSLGGLSAEGRVSLTAQLTRSAAFFADAGYAVGLGDDQGHAWGGRLGGRMTW